MKNAYAPTHDNMRTHEYVNGIALYLQGQIVTLGYEVTAHRLTFSPNVEVIFFELIFL